ncbi:PVC-type heme-binding CxxCH protein [Aquisphaera insulae]|uniref:PVC-type heme-binding CxxCH protein n=1 Tax=Aquisphaera insulae TaxID=2712864 RepID=UPI0013ECC534|nr:PVC-type heme-binding CxxCH protein [Aquisphaera insulae]
MRFHALVPALLGLACLAHSPLLAAPPGSDRLDYLRQVEPYAPGRNFPRLVTPQWIGEPGVEAAIILAVDDMKDPAAYEAFLRPILDRLRQVEGRSAMSIMTCKVDPRHPQLQAWLREGLSLEVHTLDHPCPLLQKGDLGFARHNYHDGVELLHSVPGNHPVAFRMPCCDSMNSPSPRFFAELFNKTSPGGHFLTIDSSVLNVFTPDDPSLPRELVLDGHGGERFRKYMPSPSFVNTIENYPYPYTIGNLCWEFPCAAPSDWEARNLRGDAHPRTLEDMKAAIDLTVLKQGVFCLVFHPYGWMRNDQVVALIDHATRTHGKKVRFLNFREAQERLDRNMLGGRPLRAADGSDNHVRIADLDGDGFMDVAGPSTRIWDRAGRSWKPGEPLPSFPSAITPGPDDATARQPGLRLVDVDEDGHLDRVFSNDREYGVYLFDPGTGGWTRKAMAGKAGEPNALPLIDRAGTDNGFFVHSRTLWWQNEDTAQLPDHVARRSFNEILRDLPTRARPPGAALRSIHVAPGYAVELVASEPLVKDPIAMDWGADGRLWVLEMGDYPLGIDGKGKPGGTVRVLEDADGDGRYDRATTFLDGLAIPSALFPWRNGVLVGAAPDILYAEDRDGDGKADVREVLFTGFTLGNPQHRINGFEMGLDGWIYGANGDSGGNVKSVKTGKTVSIQGRDFRFRPDTGEFETDSGQTQYGRHRDDWGNWFGNSNQVWAWHYVLSESDVRRNPFYASPDPRQVLEPDTRLYPASPTLARFNEPDQANHVTSANSPTPYRDDLFGTRRDDRMELFVSEPVHNLVHRMIVSPSGATFRGGRAPGEERSEFLASSDNWFRPTQLKTGPDGALWIADMYRAVIEHPEWIPPETQKKIDMRAGSEEGRIYRVHPVDRRPRKIERLDTLDVAGLVAALESPSGWRRDTAQRLLLHRGDRAAVGPLRSIALGSTNPMARAHALWILKLLDGLDEATLVTVLTTSHHPDLARNAVKVSEDLLATSPGIADAVLRLVDHPDARVRMQVAIALGNWKEERAGKALVRIARRDCGDPWMRAAVLSSAQPHVATLLIELFEDRAQTPPAEVVEPLAAVAGATLPRSRMDAVLRALDRPAGPNGTFAPWQLAAVNSLIEASSRSTHPIDPAAEPVLVRLIDAARKLVEAEAASESDRILAISLLRFSAATRPADRQLLVSLLAPRHPVAISQAAVQALGLATMPECPDVVLKGWTSYAPAVRSSIVDLLLSRKVWMGCLLSALEEKRIPAGELSLAHRNGLMASRDPETRRRAQAIYADLARSRQSILDAYRPATEVKGDPVAGKAVFARVCAICHKLGDVGFEVGPNLAALKEKSPEALLTAILDPNRAFESRYASFTVGTTEGRVISGLVASETDTTVTLRRQEGKEDVFLRKDIEEVAASGKSLMPEGLEKDVSQKDLSDLIAFLQGTAPPPKVVAGNHPRPVAPSQDGTIRLAAVDAEIYGERLVFEKEHQNLGFWMAADDHAAWALDVVRPGRYEVWMDAACADASAGDVLEIDLGRQQILHQMQGTGTWEDYTKTRVGELTLPAGRCRIEVRPAAPPRNALGDLRSLELKPIAPGPAASASAPGHSPHP